MTTGFRFDRGISIGHIITAVPTIVLCIFVLGSKNAALENTQADVAKLEVRLTAKIEQSQGELGKRIDNLAMVTTEQIRSVRQDIANIPDIRATLEQVRQQLARDETRLDALSQNAKDTEKVGERNSADIASILRSSIGQRMK